jgi:general secretion pathway protein J
MRTRRFRAIASDTTGFTLVELLVALALLGLLMVMLFGGLRFGTRAMTAASRRVDRSAEIATAYGFLREALANAQPLAAAEPVPQPPVRFDGEPDHLEFVVLPPGYLAPGGFRVVWIGADDPPSTAEPHDLRLTLRWQGMARGPDLVDQPAVRPSTLLDHARRIEFSYFGILQAGEAPSWHSSWHGARTLPALVRLHVERSEGAPPPDLLVAPRQADSSAAGPS